MLQIHTEEVLCHKTLCDFQCPSVFTRMIVSFSTIYPRVNLTSEQINIINYFYVINPLSKYIFLFLKTFKMQHSTIPTTLHAKFVPKKCWKFSCELLHNTSHVVQGECNAVILGCCIWRETMQSVPICRCLKKDLITSNKRWNRLDFPNNFLFLTWKSDPSMNYLPRILGLLENSRLTQKVAYSTTTL